MRAVSGSRSSETRRRSPGRSQTTPRGSSQEEVALAVDGVKKVDNQVKAAAEPGFGTKKIGQESKDSKLELEVKDKLGNEIRSYAKKIEVEVADGWTTLRGTVPDKTRKDLALKAAASVPGITKVIDLLRIKA